jgi:hypothetical protein
VHAFSTLFDLAAHSMVPPAQQNNEHTSVSRAGGGDADADDADMACTAAAAAAAESLALAKNKSALWKAPGLGDEEPDIDATP